MAALSSAIALRPRMPWLVITGSLAIPATRERTGAQAQVERFIQPDDFGRRIVPSLQITRPPGKAERVERQTLRGFSAPTADAAGMEARRPAERLKAPGA